MNKHFFSTNINELIDALKLLPGVGKKTAQRMALQLLDKQQEQAQKIANSINNALESITHCSECQMLTDQSPCHICTNTRREHDKLCIVENMLDVAAIEDAAIFQGKYFILHGRISPLDGIGPNELKLHQLKALVIQRNVKEIVLALGPSAEGEATVRFIHDMLKHIDCKITRIGFGVPFGGELEYLDQQTLSHAFNARVNF